MGISKAPAAKRALYDTLKATLPDTVGVWHSDPNTDHQGNENVTVGAVSVTQEWGSIGAANPRRDEDIDITIKIEIFQGGTDEFDAEARAWELADTIQTLISADLTLGGVVRYCRPDRLDLDPKPFAEGRLAALTITVRCRADNH